MNLEASFEDTYSLAIVTSSFGQSSQGGTFLHNDNVSISASPKAGYVFTQWDGDYHYLADRFSATNSFQMPNSSISLTPVFLQSSTQ